MKKLAYTCCYLVMICLFSCTSYYKINPSFFHDLEAKRSAVSPGFPISDFDILTFNICEYYIMNIDGTERFVDCPLNFFEISARDSIKKVEELYLLKHRFSEMVLYITTFSHRYIGKQKGFLNDPEAYNNKFYLRDTEYIYIGKYGNSDHSIIFKKQGSAAEMIWYLNEALSHEQVNTVTDIDLETTENAGSKDKRVRLEKVFSVPFNFGPSAYTLLNTISEQDTVRRVHLIRNKSEKMEIFFEMNDSLGGYRFPASKVLYYTGDW